MSRKRSIVYLGLMIGLLMTFFVIYKVSYHRAIAKMERQMIERYTALDDYYVIKECAGYITVYYSDQNTVYEYTSIPVEELPMEMQKELKAGKQVNSIKEVYGILENYSS